MLTEFSVTNYKSIRDRITLSLVAFGGDREHPEALVPVDEKDTKGLPELLKVAAIYGPNNAGKSALLDAAQVMGEIIRRSAQLGTQSALAGLLKPFRLDAEHAAKPTVFEVTWFEGAVRYEYGFAATAKEITCEWLFMWPSGRGRYRTLFERTSPEFSPEWTLGADIKGNKKVAAEACRADALYLSVAAALKNETLGPIWERLTKRARFYSATHSRAYESKVRALEDKEFQAWVFDALKAADLGITGGRLETKDAIPKLHEAGSLMADALAGLAEQDGIPPEELRAAMGEFMGMADKAHRIRVLLSHAGEGKTVEFDLEEDESHGTRQYFGLLGLLYEVMEQGGVLFVDEFDANLHPLLLREIIDLFQSPRNRKNAQLVFTTHQVLLLDPVILRRDQIYLMDKTSDGVSHMSSLLDFKVRKNEAWCKGYLGGRYGAVPSLYLTSLAGAGGPGE